MTVSLASLIIRETKAAIYKTALGIAESIGLPVSTWQAGDPTRSLLHLESEVLSALEEVVVGYIRAGFLDYAAELAAEAAATGDTRGRAWLKVVAKQVFNIDVPEATYATTTVTLTNGGGGIYGPSDLAPGTLTFKNSATGKTYRNTTGGTPDTLASGPGTTVTMTVEAEEPGSESSAGAGEIDTLVTGLLGVTVTNADAAIGVDEQDPATTVQQCRDKLDSLSPNGPKGAYSYVARNPDLTGTHGVTRVRVYSESDTGDVTVYLAGPSGGVSSSDRDLVETAILAYATPLCITPTVLAASNLSVAITYELWIYKSCNKTAEEIEADVLSALESMIASRSIGGDIIPPATTGKLHVSLIESVIRNVFPQCFKVAVTLPAADVTLTNSQVATLGAVTATVHIMVDP